MDERMSDADVQPGVPVAEPQHGFDDSRRLTGPNRYFADSAVTLTPLGRFSSDAAVHEAWAQRVRTLSAALGWPDPEPRRLRRASETLLVFRAPPDVLFTATDINEWAWERAAHDAGERAFDLAHDLGPDARPVFVARAAAERRPEIAALRVAAAAHGISTVSYTHLTLPTN